MNKENRSETSKEVQPSRQWYEIIRGGGARLLQYHVEILSAVFNVLNKYRQYYLSRPYLKAIIFHILGKIEESKKLKEYVFECCDAPLKKSIEYLNNSRDSYSKFKKIYKEVSSPHQKWISSKEFNEKYIKTNHPFPPYLNPDEVDYSKIDADLAWDLNLPLPNNYQFLCVMSSFGAHTSMVNYLQKCDVAIAKDHLGDGRLHYIFDYKEVSKNYFFVVNITAYAGTNEYYKNLEKLISMIDNKKVPVLWVVRCPFQRLLSALNNSWGNKNVIYNFNENTPLSYLENRKSYWIDKNLSLTERIKKAIELNTFVYAKLHNIFDKMGFKNHTFLDLQNYQNKQDIFMLFNQLSKTYGFNPPKYKNDFSYKYVTLYNGILPLYYKINDIKFIISHEYLEYIEVSSILNIVKSDYTKDIFIYTYSKNVKEVNTNNIKEKIQEFMDKLSQILEFELRHNKMNQETLMQFLRNNKECRCILRKIFKDELMFLNKNRPDIVSSWRYYWEFEKMCETLDDNKK